MKTAAAAVLRVVVVAKSFNIRHNRNISEYHPLPGRRASLTKRVADGGT